MKSQMDRRLFFCGGGFLTAGRSIPGVESGDFTAERILVRIKVRLHLCVSLSAYYHPRKASGIDME
jgi:hypothetical protein